ncbi:hypothetical protein QO058_20495 [Bosea vestrisii]|uniref:helix-turn-helix transcriptional regulator n=1 Tax=Bosea vestrisii TaxID=151416 RepID=UPI0024E02A40|nr:hypothetical protein [Bosea vestrisii]WID95161.1 hypothetical protein QO058_20495 [Bosea vestrisii]
MLDSEIANRMRELAIGEISAVEAKSMMSDFFGRAPELAARKTYPALQEVAWRFIRSRSAPEDIDEWLGVFRFCEQLLDRHELPASARQIEALGDIVARTARYAELQPPDSVLSRRHVVPLLEKLRREGGRLPRKDLKRHLEVEEANLSRLIALLEAGRLVVRKVAGREAMIELTPEGLRSIPAPQAVPDVYAEIGLLLNDAKGAAVSVRTAKEELFATSGFEDTVGLPAAAAATLLSESGSSGWLDLQTAEHRWARCVSLPTTGDKSAALWVDISDLKETVDRAHQRIDGLEAELASVRASKEAILARQARLKAYRNAVERRLEARISGAKRSAALAYPGTLASQNTDLLHELGEIQSVVFAAAPLTSPEQVMEPVSAYAVFDEVVKLASFFSEDELKASASELPSDLPIASEPVLDTFRNCAARGVRFRELKLSGKNDGVVFAAYADLDFDPASMTVGSGQTVPGFHIEKTVQDGAYGIQIYTPISGAITRKIA